MTRKLAVAASALALVGALTACAPNGAAQSPAPSLSPTAGTSTIQAQVETAIDGSASFDDVEAMLTARQRPILLVPNGGTLWLTGLPAECTLQPDYQFWGSAGEEREVGGIGYAYEGDTLAISATDTPVAWSTTARFTCGSGSELKIEVTP